MKFAILAVLALVFVLGCVGGQRSTTVSANEGVRISSFTTTPSVIEVFSGDSVIFDVEAENIGGTDARNVEVTLYGVEGQWRDPSGGGVVSQITSRSFGTLRPPQPERNLPGDFRAAQWEFKTPQIPQGITTPASVEARVTYDYNMNGFLQFTTVNDEEYRRQQITGSTIEPPIVQNSNGPLKLSVPSTAKSTFIIVDTEGASDDPNWYVYPLKIEFQNTGSGFPTGDPAVSTDEGKLTGTIKILGSNVEFSNCLGQTSGTTLDLDSAVQGTGSDRLTVRLRETQNVPIVCNIKFSKSSWRSLPTGKVSLVFDINYKYFTKQSVSVNVIGKKEA
ncbi:MAG: hypothetical protein HYW27_01155 [Candidatus Aenigmarchaeota archaeon]|nr:hypothetical protein [Candidatus Aenigmarchaeota archaeon]